MLFVTNNSHEHRDTKPLKEVSDADKPDVTQESTPISHNTKTTDS